MYYEDGLIAYPQLLDGSVILEGKEEAFYFKLKYFSVMWKRLSIELILMKIHLR